MSNNSDNINELSTIKRAMLAVQQLTEKLETLQKEKNEPIAVIGMGCRFPGQVNNTEDFHTFLKEGREGITEIPPEHWNHEKYYNSDPTKPGKIYTRYGGFVPNLENFDASFFRIAPREAKSLDPQQRLLLEVSWEALENAGIVPAQLAGSNSGVFIGICGNDYLYKLLERDDQEIDAYMTTGNTHSLASGRLSYTLGLIGPSLSVNTACSSSLVAIHLAINSLRNQECNLAIVGGVNRIISPQISINFAKARMLSPDGCCKTFDAEANGFVRSEGCGVIILKRLNDAIIAGDNILALLSGSAINQDGRTSGLTVPSSESQKLVIEQALKNSQIKPETVSYIEAHGTGTFLGDPIEVEALGQVFATHRHQPLFMGSVKSNLGHLEAAAGMAGVIKVILSLHKDIIYPQVNFKTPNPHIDWETLPISVPTQLSSWPSSVERRIAGVSSFGFSGTNAHVIITEVTSLDKKITTDQANITLPFYLLTISAKSDIARKILAEHYADYLVSHSNISLSNLCYTTNVCRSHFSHRLVIITASISQAQEQLTDFYQGKTGTNIYQGEVSSDSPKLAVLFTESQYQNLETAHYFYQTQPIFKEAIDRCANVLSLSIPNVLEENKQVSSLISLSIDYAFFSLWKSWGIQATAVVGSGLGLWLAAIVAEVFTLEDGLKLLLNPGDTDYFSVCSLPTVPLLDVRTGEIIEKEIIASLLAENLAKSEPIEMDILKQKNYNLVLKVNDFLSDSYQDCWQHILTVLAQFHLQGVSIDWSAFWQNESHQKVGLPTYPFQRRRFWITAPFQAK